MNQWYCNYCGYSNDEQRTECRQCFRPRPLGRRLSTPSGAVPVWEPEWVRRARSSTLPHKVYRP